MREAVLGRPVLHGIRASYTSSLLVIGYSLANTQAQDCLCNRLYLAAPLSGEGITLFPAVIIINEKTQLTLGLWGF